MKKLIRLYDSKGFHEDDSGSIEGLPLQLMIVGLIASLGMAVIVGWISSIDTPEYVGQVMTEPGEIILHDPDGDDVYEANLEELWLKVLDTNGNGMPGVSIVIQGASIDNQHNRYHGSTGSDGTLTIRDPAFRSIGDSISTLDITIIGQQIAHDYRTEIMVIPD